MRTIVVEEASTECTTTSDRKSASKDPTYTEPWYRFERVLTALGTPGCRVRRNAKWLDLGCHQGQFAKMVSERYGADVLGIDDWNSSLKTEDSWRYTKRDLEHGFELGESFDFISGLEVIEHMTDTDRFLASCWSHLNEEGTLILSTPNINSLRNRLTVPFGRYRMRCYQLSAVLIR